jgi:hypothetical protein
VNDYDPSIPGPTSCTGYPAAGKDVVYVADLQAGDLLHLVYTTPNHDGSIYVVTNCASPGTSCVVGEDDPEPETINWTATATGTYYIIADAYGSGAGGAFTLAWSITCPTMGACCYSDLTCVVTTQAGCTGMYWTAGGDCSIPCVTPPVYGACCDHATGNCTLTVSTDCIYDWLGANVPCNTTTCAPPIPTERTTWGQIKNQYR